MIARVALLIAFVLGACGREPAAVQAECGESEAELIARVRAIDPQDGLLRPRVIVFSVSDRTARAVRGLCGGLFRDPFTGDLATAEWNATGRPAYFGCSGFIGTTPRTYVSVYEVSQHAESLGLDFVLYIDVLAPARAQVENGARYLAERLGANAEGSRFVLPEGHDFGDLGEIHESFSDSGWFEVQLTIVNPPARLADVELR